MACVAFMIYSCGSSQNAAPLNSLSGDWNIVEINGISTIPGMNQDLPNISFDLVTGRISGYSGCNRMMGSFDVNARPGTLDMGSLGGTRMLCSDMTMEKNVLNALNQVRGYRMMSNGRIALTNSSKRPVVVLEKRVVGVGFSALDGDWKIVEAGGIAVPSVAPNGAAKQPFLSFDTAGKTIHGNAGCNSINGGFVTKTDDARAISFPGVASTMMACPDMTLERRVTMAINDVRSFNIMGDGTVRLYNEAGVTVLVLARR